MEVTTTEKPRLRVVAIPVVALAGLAMVGGCSSKTQDSPTITMPSVSPTAGATELAVVVKGGKAQGGVKTLSAKLSAQVVLTVTSTDTTSEIHLHGYDLKADLAPGKAALISFKASISGVFEIELESTSVKIATLTVR